MTRDLEPLTILSCHPGHDGASAFVRNGELVFSHEAEKDNLKRHAKLTPSLLFESLSEIGDAPRILAISGWVKQFLEVPKTARHHTFHSVVPSDAGYYGVGPPSVLQQEIKV